MRPSPGARSSSAWAGSHQLQLTILNSTRTGCPTLATFLSLSLGWDTTNLNSPLSTQFKNRVPRSSSAWVGSHQPQLTPLNSTRKGVPRSSSAWVGSHQPQLTPLNSTRKGVPRSSSAWAGSHQPQLTPLNSTRKGVPRSSSAWAGSERREPEASASGSPGAPFKLRLGGIGTEGA